MSRLGPLHEPQFRLLWFGRTTSSIGDALIPVALAFAVIDETGSATDLGLVMAAYTLARVVLILVGSAEIWHLAVAGAVSGGAQAFFGPASTALVPDTVSPARLQQANALVGMTGSGAELFGPALSGVLVAAVGPGWVFAVDAASFALSAVFLLAMRVRASYTGERSRDSVDAGAVGVAVLFEAVSKAWREAELERA